MQPQHRDRCRYRLTQDFLGCFFRLALAPISLLIFSLAYIKVECNISVCFRLCVTFVVLHFEWIILCVRNMFFYFCVVCCVFYLVDCVRAWQMLASCLDLLVSSRNLLNNS